MRGRSKLFPLLLIAAVIAIAAIATVAAMGGLSPGVAPTPSPTATPTSTALPVAEDVFANEFYAVIVVGGEVHQLGFGFFNGSTETITIRKVEFWGPDGDLGYTISEEDIAATWGSGEVPRSEYFSGSIDFDTARAESEVEQWVAMWHCIRADGQDFVVLGSYED